jgi:hypothetical protein
MTERRFAERLVVKDGTVGGLRVLQDVEIERASRDEITIVSTRPIPRGERMRLESLYEDQARQVTVRAVECQTLIASVFVQRVRLQVVGVVTEEQQSEPREAGARPTPQSRGSSPRPVVAALVRRVPIRLLDISASGCAFDMPAKVDEGTVGFLDVTLDGGPYEEAIRICRSSRVRLSTWPYRLGAEFLTLAPPSSASLRHAVIIQAQEQTDHAPSADNEVPGQHPGESTDL